MVSTRLVISKSSIFCTNPLVTVPRVPITIGITVTFMFHSFFNSLARSRYFHFLSILLCGQPGQQSPQFGKFSFLLIIIKSDRDLGSVCISKSQRNLCMSFSMADSGLCIHHLFAWSKSDFLHIPNGSPCPSSRV